MLPEEMKPSSCRQRALELADEVYRNQRSLAESATELTGRELQQQLMKLELAKVYAKLAGT
jgi:hypothetical protein